MASTSFRLEVVTPERVVFDGPVTSLVLPAADGLMGILPNHAPIVAALDVGEVTVSGESGGPEFMMVSDGFFEMADNHARILADTGERAEEIDPERAQQSEERARERLTHRGDADHALDVMRAERALNRAMWRRIIKQHSGR